MNLLFAYPIILPSSSGGSLPVEVLWAILIVCNGIGIVTLLLALLINQCKNKNNKYRKESLFETIDNYLLLWLGISLALFVDVIAIFVGLVIWVSVLL